MNVSISEFQNFQPRVPEGDNQQRMVCTDCNWVHYDNPRIILTGFCIWQGQILLCRRALPPRYGFWTLPGGFMEVGETVEDGTIREVREEARAQVSISGLLGAYSVSRIGQVHMVFLADMQSDQFAPGPESLDVRLFPLRRDTLPWQELAFPVNRWALEDYLSLNGKPLQQPFLSRPEHQQERMAPEPFHPDFPPPNSTSARHQNASAARDSVRDQNAETTD